MRKGPVEKQSLDEILEHVSRDFPEGTRIAVYAPIAKEKKGEFKKELDLLKKKGYVRIEIDGIIYDLEDELSLDKNKRHTINLVVDRLKVREENKSRLADSIEMALHEGNGFVEIVNLDIFRRRYSANILPVPYAG